MRKIHSIFILFLIIPVSSLFAQLTCGQGLDLASIVDFKTDGLSLDVDIINAQYSGGTCGTINYKGQEINGTSGFDVTVNISTASDKVLCGLVDGTLPSPLDLITIDPTFRCEYNILNMEGYIEAYAISAYPNASLEKKITSTVDREDIIQIYSPSSTTIELPLQVSASLVTMQTFCVSDPNHSVAEAKASVTASLGANSMTLTDVARVSGGFLDDKFTSLSQAVSISVPFGTSTLKMKIKGEMSAMSRVRGPSPLGVVVCGSNAGANVGHINVGNFTGPNGDPLPPGVQIVGLSTGVNYSNPESSIDCIHIPPPGLVIKQDSCGKQLGTATVSPVNPTYTYKWNNQYIDTMALYLTHGDHFIKVTDTANCARDFQFFVDDPEAPDFVMPRYITINENETVTLAPLDNPGPGYSYNWSTGESTPTIVVGEGSYYVFVTTPNNCSFRKDVAVKEATSIDFTPFLTANYPFSSNADDLSGNNNHGTVHGATLTEDRVGKLYSAYYFDGIDDYIELPAVPETQPDSAVTFTAWFKTDGLPINPVTIIKNSGQGYEATVNQLRPGKLNSQVALPTGIRNNLSPFNHYADDQWHAFALTYDGKTGILRMFIDGILVNESFGTPGDVLYQSGTPITIGKDGIGNTNFFKGTIDDVKIFSGALNEQELQYLFLSQKNLECFEDFYAEDFEGILGAEWSDTLLVSVDTINAFGWFHEDTVVLTLPNVPVGGTVEICFDLYLIDSWDGISATWGPDIFILENWDRKIINTTFSNKYYCDQNYPSDYYPGNLAMNEPGFSAVLNEHLTGGTQYAETMYEICRTFVSEKDSLQLRWYAPFIDQEVNFKSELWGLDDVTIKVKPPTPQVGTETITCNTNGSYLVTVPFLASSNNLDYMAYEQNNTFGDIDTVYFTDDGSVTSIAIGPYNTGRDYNVVIAPEGVTSGCYPILSDTSYCTFTGTCNLDVNFVYQCIGDSLTVTGTISGGMAPYSVYGNGYTAVLLPGDGEVFSYTIYDCSSPVEVVVTDLNMCTYEDSLMTHIETPYTVFCLGGATVYPNPVDTELFVSVSDVCGVTTVTVFNALGQEVLSNHLVDTRTPLDVSRLDAGVYLLSLENEYGRRGHKFVKM